MSLPLRFATHDHQRAVAAATAASQVQASTTAQLQALEKSIAEAVTNKGLADKAVLDAAAALTAAEAAKTIADQAAIDAGAAAEKAKNDATVEQAVKDQAAVNFTNAQTAATAAAESVTAKSQLKSSAAAAKAAADKSLEQLQAMLKPAQDAKTAAEKAAAAVLPKVKSTEERLQALNTAGVTPKPEQTRLIETFKHTRSFLSCRIDPTGDYVFGGSQDNSIQRWDLVLGQQIPLAAHKSWVADFDFQPGTNQLISAAYEGKLQWWESPASSPSAVRNVAAHKGQIRSIAFSLDGQYIVTGGNDKVARIWRAADGALLKELTGHKSHVYHVAFHPNGKHLVTGELLGTVKQWEVESWQFVRDFDASPLHKYDPTFKADCGGIRAIAFSPDGRFMATGGIGEVTNAFAGIGKPTVLVFDWLTGQRIHLMNSKGNFQGSVWGLHFHPNGEFLIGAGGGGSGAIWFWNADSGTPLLDLAIPSSAFDLSLHPDGLRLAVACFDNTIKIYDMGPKFEPMKKP